MWKDKLKSDPLPTLFTCDNDAILYLVGRELLGSDLVTIDDVWDMPVVQKMLRKQRADGSWKYPGKRAGQDLGENYELVETWKTLRMLIGKYSFHREHPVIRMAAEYIFSCQTEEGDIRGILSNQYMPYYNGVILELLIRAGYGEDLRVRKGLDWLLSMRQDDGGWIIPLMVHKMQYFYEVALDDPIQPQRDLPFSHMATGMVIRGFCCHPAYKELEAVQHAGRILADRMFQKDVYTSRKVIKYWYYLQYPYWWTAILSALDSLHRLGFDASHPKIDEALNWLIDNQRPSGTWQASYDGSDLDADLWVTYDVCRLLKAYLGD